MDGNRFDDLTRAMAATRSRRQVLKGLAAAAMAAVAGRRTISAAPANKVRVCHRSGAARGSVALIEVPANAVAAHQAHGDVIDPDFDNDPANCGGCAIACDDGDPCTSNTCVAGACVFSPIVCPTCQTCVGGSCVADGSQEGLACGDDGDPCIDHVCRAGSCTAEAADGRQCDDGDACTTGDVCADGACAGTPIECPLCQACAGGVCESVASDLGCSTACCNGACCAAGQTCINGSCQQAACLPVRSICDLTDPACCQDVPTICSVEANCRADQGEVRCCRPIGQPCTGRCDCCGNASCINGVCSLDAGQQCLSTDECAGDGVVCCSGICRDTQTDENNCGRCGRICETSTLPNSQPLCAAGFCLSECNPGFSTCNDACVDLRSDEANCGACGNVCAGNETCCGGVCRNHNTDEAHCGACGNACADGHLCCGGTCRNVQTDPSNCGGCGDICAIDDVCVAGECRLAACKAIGDMCDESSDCCSGFCNGSVCECSPGGFPSGGSCSGDSDCCQGRCVLGACICFPPALPPVIGVNGPCVADRDCCTGACTLDPTGTVGLCTCLPIGAPCDTQFQCCSGNCNALPFGGSVCSPFE